MNKNLPNEIGFRYEIEGPVKEVEGNIFVDASVYRWHGDGDRSDEITAKIPTDSLFNYAWKRFVNDVHDTSDHGGDHVQTTQKASPEMVKAYLDDNRRELIQDYLKEEKDWEVIG